MVYREFPPTEWQAFSRLQSATSELDQKCLSILTGLQESFVSTSILEAGSCTIELNNDAAMPANFLSPLGVGRFVRTYARSRGDLWATLVLQRKAFDEYNRERWTPVWSLQVPRYDSPFIGTEDIGLRFELTGIFNRRSNELFSMAMSLLDAMVDHPRV